MPAGAHVTHAAARTLPQRDAAPRRIAIFRALQLGDMLCAVPALRALRAAYPSAQVTLVGLPWAQAFVDRYPMLVDDLVVFPGARGFPEQTESDAGLPAFYAASRARGYDLAVQLHGSGGVANDIVARMGAARCAGFVQPQEPARDGCFIPWPDKLREPERYLALVRALGVPADDATLWFPLTAADEREADAICARHAVVPGRAVVVHAGAQWASRRWPVERFAAVADALAAAGLQVLLTGTQGEAALVERVAAWMRRPAVLLAGRTSLGGLAALIRRVPLVVCNDTGVSHVAAAMRTRSVVVASGSDTRRWAPGDRRRHRVLAVHPPCRPCAYAECPVGHPCALAIVPAAVLAAARSQLVSARAEAATPRPGAH